MARASLYRRNADLRRVVAEGVGFEPTLPSGKPVFKTGALDRSAIPPLSLVYYIASERWLLGRKDFPGLP